MPGSIKHADELLPYRTVREIYAVLRALPFDQERSRGAAPCDEASQARLRPAGTTGTEGGIDPAYEASFVIARLAGFDG